MKKLFKKINLITDFPGVNIALGIYCILGSFFVLFSFESRFFIWFSGFAFSLGFGLLIEGIDCLIEKKKKADDQEKTGQ